MFQAIASFWVMIIEVISGMTRLARAFNSASAIVEDGATNLRKEMQLESISKRKELIKANGLSDTDVKEATTPLTDVSKAA